MAKAGQDPSSRTTHSTRRSAHSQETLSPRELAGLAARGPASVEAGLAILRSPSDRERLTALWADLCPDPDLVSRAVLPDPGMPQHEMAALTRQVLLELHAGECPRCSAVLAAMDQNDVLVHDFRRRAARPNELGRDWWPTARLSAQLPGPAGQDSDIQARLQPGRVVIQAATVLVAGEVYVTCAGPCPLIRRVVLREEGNSAVATVHVPDDVTEFYVDVALDREPAFGRIAEVDFAAGAAAASATPMTTDRRRHDHVHVTSADGRTAALRVVTGVDGANVRLRLTGPEPVGGVWTAAGERLGCDVDVVVLPSRPTAVEEILFGLEMR